MKFKSIKRVTAALITASMLSGSLPVMAAQDYLVDIGFDNIVTNEQCESVSVDGSSSARVVEDGSGNKSYAVECGNVDNTLKVFFPEYTEEKRYCIQFDIRLEGAPAEGKITLNNPAGTSVDILTINENGILCAKDGREIGGINSPRMSTVTIMIDNEVKTNSIGINGRIKYYRQELGVSVPGVSELAISTYASKSDTVMYIDNVRIYNGEKYINKKGTAKYNDESIDYIAEDETGLSDKIYYKNKLDSLSSMSMSKLAKRNTIEWVEDGEGGYARITKSTSDDAMIDMNIGQTTKRVVAECDIRFSKNIPETLFYMRDNSTSAQVNIAPLTIKGDKVIAQGAQKQLRKNTWYKISLAMDIAKHTYAVYVDGELLADGMSFNTDFSNISIWRMYIGGTSLGSVDIDNLAMYGGTEPRDIENATVTAKSRYSDTTAISFLKGKRAIQLYSSTAFLNGEKKQLDNSVVIKNDEGLVPQSAFEEFFAVSAAVSGDTITAGNAKLSIGSDTMTVGGKEYKLDAAPELIDGILYLPARGYGKYAEVKGFVDDGHGMLIIGSNLTDTDARLKPANLYLFFERKTAEELKTQFLDNTDNGTKHPRLIATADDFERLRREVKTDSLKASWYERVIALADGNLDSAVLEYKINGGRLLDVSNSALGRLELLGFAYQMTGDKRYAEKGIAEMEAICSFPDWHPDHYLDTGTMSSAVAIGFDWLYDAMTEEQRESIAKAAQKFGLATAKQAYFSSADFNDFWADTETNWGFICNGGIANLALATGEYNTDETMEILYNALRGIEIPWYRIAPDGAWYEGTGYWSYLLTHMTLFMSSYKTAMNEQFGENYMGMDKYAYFQAYFQGPDGLPNNFHDADEATVENAGQFYMADVYNDTSLMLYRISQMEQYGFTPGIFDIIWCKAGIQNESSSINLDKEKYFGETEFVSMREDWNRDDSAWLSFHGGYSNNAHDHVDVGTFVYNIGGVRWAVDVGREMLSYVSDNVNPAILAGYDSKYFYRRKGEGHNIVVINPDENLEQDISAFAAVNKPVGGTTGAYDTIDLSASYAVNANSYIRGYLLTDNRRTLTVRDEIKLKDNSELHWFMHTKGDIRIIDNNTAIIYQDGKQLKLQFITSAADAELKAVAAEPLPKTPEFTNTENTEFSKIDYEINASGSVTITVKMSLVGERGSETGVDDVDIADWDTLINRPSEQLNISYGSGRLSGIYSDGELVKDFSPEKFSYSVSKYENGKAPVITVGENDTVSTETYQCYDGTDMMLLNAADENGKTVTYTVNITDYEDTNIDVYDKYQLTAKSASSEQVEEGINNIMSHSVDNDYATRWSAEGVNEWCIYDLGEEKRIDAFAVAFWMGGQRQFSFDIAVSNDGRNFTKVITATTKGNTEDPVVYVPDKTLNARYIKFMGHGSNVNEWNNVIEFMALKKK